MGRRHPSDREVPSYGVSELANPAKAREFLDAATTNVNGQRAAASTAIRHRTITANAIDYARELGAITFTTNPVRAVVQRIFYLTAINFCRQNGISVTPESNAGRGPVDFAFGKNWKDRALVELKLVRNSAFWDGIMKQVPTYARAEEIHAAFFVGVAYTDGEMAAASREKVERAAALASEENGIAITPLIIDARRKISASKERMTPAEREELRDAQATEHD